MPSPPAALTFGIRSRTVRSSMIVFTATHSLSLSDDEWVAVNTIIEERTVRDLIPRLKAAGGQGIVEYPLNKIVV